MMMNSADSIIFLYQGKPGPKGPKKQFRWLQPHSPQDIAETRSLPDKFLEWGGCEQSGIQPISPINEITNLCFT